MGENKQELKPYMDLSWEEQGYRIRNIVSCDDKGSYITICVGCLNKFIQDIVHEDRLTRHPTDLIPLDEGEVKKYLWSKVEDIIACSDDCRLHGCSSGIGVLMSFISEEICSRFGSPNTLTVSVEEIAEIVLSKEVEWKEMEAKVKHRLLQKGIYKRHFIATAIHSKLRPIRLPEKKIYPSGHIQPTCRCKECLKADGHNQAIDEFRRLNGLTEEK